MTPEDMNNFHQLAFIEISSQDFLEIRFTSIL